MLDTKPGNLFDEITAAEKFRDEFLHRYADQLKRYHTSAYRESSREQGFPENYYHAYVSSRVATLVGAEPRLDLTTSRGKVQSDTVQGLESYGNRWFIDSNYAAERERAATDYCFNWCVGMVLQEPRLGFEQADDPPMSPVFHRLSQRRWGCDPRATSLENARYQFHRYTVDKDAQLLIAAQRPEDGWDVAAINGMAADSGLEPWLKDRKTPQRKDCSVWEIWIPEEVLPESAGPKFGFHGTIHTIAVEGGSMNSSDRKGIEIRKPRPFYGPRWGPYVLGGEHVVPDDIFNLSALVACNEQIEELGKASRVNINSAHQRKNIALVDGLRPADAQKIIDAVDGDVLVIPGLDKTKVVDVDLGGVTEDALLWEQVMRSRCDRNLRMSDATNGQVTGVGTATENAIAKQSNDQGAMFSIQKFDAFESRMARTVLWYAYHDGRTIGGAAGGGLFLGGQGPETADAVKRAAENGLMDPMQAEQLIGMLASSGGSFEQGSGATFDDLEVRIRSVRRDGREQARVAAVTEIVATTLPIFMQFAGVFDAGAYYRWVGQQYDVPELSDWLNMDLLAVMGAVQFMSGMAGGGAGGEPGQPGQPGAGGANQPPRQSQDVGMGKQSANGSPPTSTANGKAPGQRKTMADKAA